MNLRTVADRGSALAGPNTQLYVETHQALKKSRWPRDDDQQLADKLDNEADLLTVRALMGLGAGG